MTVSELIAALQKLPPDLPVGYVNDCADNGSTFMEPGPELSGLNHYYRGMRPDNMPAECVVL